MADFFDSFLERLKPVEDKYTAEDYILAEKHLPKDVTEPIPLCIYRALEQVDADGDPVRLPRMDVISILAWVIAQRKRPEITLQDVQRGINNSNLRDVVRDIWYFWTDADRETIEQMAGEVEENPTEKAREPESQRAGGEEEKENSPGKTRGRQ